jgi:hypothetical protein
MIQNLIKQAYLDGYAKGEKCDWVKPSDAKENMANDYATEVVNKNDLLPDVSWRSELLISFCEYLHKRSLLNVVKENIPIRVKLFLKRN